MKLCAPLKIHGVAMLSLGKIFILNGVNYKLYFWALLLISAVLFFAPITVGEQSGLGLDKLAHVILFAGLLFFGKGGVKGFRKEASKIDPVFTFLVLYALVVEFVQGEFLPYRSFDWLDAVAGWVGLLIGIIYFWYEQSREKRI